MSPRLYFAFLVICALCACGRQVPSEVEEVWKTLPKTVDYNFHVKPLLSDRCFACHGPDAQNQQAELRLDIEEEAYAALASGNGHAVNPGSSQKSQVVHRILSTDPEIQMPPPESNLSLSAYEKGILIKWIRQGAEYKEHWAFTKPEKSKIPATVQHWGVNEIDQFVLAKLEENDIAPSEEAVKAVQIRRLFFDITGLPPSLEDLERLMADSRSDYYEQLVDSLLGLQSYGERMAAHWMDVARFADSEGYLDDFHHTFWPYRDWVIDAYNRNLPYDQFITWQLGGDQMPNPTREQKLATAFNRNHKQNSEGGIIPEEFRVEYVADRTNTVGTAFLGLTVGCARCHDHKYDPFSQKNYFELFSFFNSTIERGDGIFAYNSVENGIGIPNKLSMNAGPVLPLPDPEVEGIRAHLLSRIQTQQSQISELAASDQPAMQWLDQKPTVRILEKKVREATRVHLPFDDAKNGKTNDLALGSKNATYHHLEVVPGKYGQAIRSDAKGQLVADGRRISFERMEPFTVSFWINTPKAFDEAHVLYNGNNRIQGYRGWDVMIQDNHLYFRLNHAHPYQSISVFTKEALPTNEWVHFTWTYDGSSKAEGMNVYRNGSLVEQQVERDYLYRSTKPYTDNRATVYMPYQGLIIGNRHYDQDFTGGLLDEVRVLNIEADALIASFLHDRDEGRKRFLDAVQNRSSLATRFYHQQINPQIKKLQVDLRAMQAQEIEAIDTVQELMVMGDWEKERQTYILDRGVYDAHGAKVSSDIPNGMLEWPEGVTRNRYGLAQWITHPDHPLTSRVAVNQMWYLFFGRGIVETVEDFGNQGALPSHPELLDWLAVDFVENGWNVKRLIKQMVLSATYRQSSIIRPELEQIDPDNVLLARAPRYRRSAEMVRDNLLAASDLLDPTLGGPSAFPYQPPNLWGEVSSHPFFPDYKVNFETGLYRRSLYTFWKRNMPPPSMLVFDASSRGECQVRRQRSSTPLQALVLLNDPQVIEACRALAVNTIRQESTINESLISVSKKLLGRGPTGKELELLARQYEDELEYFASSSTAATQYLQIGKYEVPKDLAYEKVAALSRVANTITNSTEGYYKN